MKRTIKDITISAHCLAPDTIGKHTIETKLYNFCSLIVSSECINLIIKSIKLGFNWAVLLHSTEFYDLMFVFRYRS